MRIRACVRDKICVASFFPVWCFPSLRQSTYYEDSSPRTKRTRVLAWEDPSFDWREHLGFLQVKVARPYNKRYACYVIGMYAMG